MTDAQTNKSSVSPRQTLIKRLTGYWKFEAANVVLLPAAMLYLAGGNIGVATVAAAIPMMALLAIGAAYWRAKLHQLTDGVSPAPTVRRIAALQTPALIGAIIAVLVAVGAWTIGNMSVGNADRWAATFAAIMAVLEYINYYHRQLQHFDHREDWQRLLSGRGFRKSQLRQDIDRLGSE